MFGGLGQNFVNPALTARIILQTSFPSAMNVWSKPFSNIFNSLDTITTATPLSKDFMPNISYLHLLLGIKGGCIGEVCGLALILGGFYLIVKNVISPVIPFSYILTVFICSWALGKDPFFQVLTGGLLLGAFFMATDYVTSPLTTKGHFIFGIGCGLITVLIRSFGALPEGVSFSILLMNILVPYIDKLTSNKKFFKRRNFYEKNKIKGSH